MSILESSGETTGNDQDPYGEMSDEMGLGNIKPEDSAYLSCLNNGKIYKNGETFTATMEGLPIDKEDQCMHCICQVSLW